MARTCTKDRTSEKHVSDFGLEISVEEFMRETSACMGGKHYHAYVVTIDGF